MYLSADGRALRFPDAQLAAGDVFHVYRDGSLYGSMTYSGGPQIARACAGSSRFTAIGEPGHTIADVNAWFNGPAGDSYDNRMKWRRGDNPAVVTVDRPLFIGETVAVTSEADTFWATGAAGPLIVVSRNVFTVATMCPRPALRAMARSMSRLPLKRLARARRVTLPLAAVAPGTTRVRVTTRTAGGTVTLGTGSRTRAEVGTVRLAVPLTRAGRAVLKRSARVRVRVAASFTPTDGPATRTTVRFTLD